MVNLPIIPIGNVAGTKHIKPAQTPAEAQKRFASYLKDSMDKVNQAQIDADVMAEKLAQGRNVELHEVMITAQKASITLAATMEIRNKVVEAYQEVMRMQV